MKNFTAVLLGIVIASCAARSKSAAPPTASSAEPISMGATNPRAELDQLDADITAQMSKLGVERPAPAPACTNECAQQMSTAAAAAVASDPQCKPAQSEKCTESCTLKDSICKNAGRICEIASQLGGNDAYANDKCTSGTASCDAAKQRCCSCM